MGRMPMKSTLDLCRRIWQNCTGTAFAILLFAAPSFSQTCVTADDMDASTRAALQSAANRYFDMVARGDAASLKQNSIPSVANDFSAIENTIKDNQTDLAGSHAVVRPPYQLKAEGAAPLPRAEFLCGIFDANGQTATSAEFIIPNLPPGNYAIVILDVSTQKTPYTLSLVLQQDGTDWKMGGFFLRPAQIGGHDGKWFLDRAQVLKTQGHIHAAWLYFLEGRDLAVPVPFMDTQLTDKLYDEASAMKPPDFPADGSTADLTAPTGKTYKLTDIFPFVSGQELDVVVKYQTASVSDLSQAFQENIAVMKALLLKFPELRDSFVGVVARGVEPSGRDYGSMLPTKDIK
jgi:hypothetical protein